MTRPPANKGLIYIHHTQTALKGRVGTCACGNEHGELGCPIAAGCIRGIVFHIQKLVCSGDSGMAAHRNVIIPATSRCEVAATNTKLWDPYNDATV